jgi:ATP-dependent Zn protease
MARITRELKRTAYHEAGHAVMRLEFGFRLTRCTIKRVGDYAGSTEGDTDLGEDGSNDHRVNTERMAQVFLAGHIAEKCFDPKGTPRFTGRDDFMGMNVILRDFCTDVEELKAYTKFLEIRTRNMVSESTMWWKIQAVADALLERETMTGEEIKVICEAVSL